MNMKKEVRLFWRWFTAWMRFLPSLIRNKPLVWVKQDGSEETLTEQWSRRNQVKIIRPRYNGLTRTAECGCAYRRITGRRYLICSNHVKWRRRRNVEEVRNDDV